ncbi:MAG: DNA polymerase III subunit chi [Gammaproteobacteria bacterium]|nr:DNA polymerase III subunit chi [Gammaproteobacteria bacterium]
MPQIDFYIVDDRATDAWLRYACRLVEKAYNLGMHVHIHTPNESLTKQMDELLWVFRDRSFIPHQQTCAENELCAVTLNHLQLPAKRELLVNLSPDAPDFYNQFERVIEVVSTETAMKQKARDRFRFYKEKGDTPTHHQVS